MYISIYAYIYIYIYMYTYACYPQVSELIDDVFDTVKLQPVPPPDLKAPLIQERLFEETRAAQHSKAGWSRPQRAQSGWYGTVAKTPELLQTTWVLLAP